MKGWWFGGWHPLKLPPLSITWSCVCTEGGTPLPNTSYLAPFRATPGVSPTWSQDTPTSWDGSASPASPIPGELSFKGIAVSPSACGDPVAPQDWGRFIAKFRICQKSLAWCPIQSAASETLLWVELSPSHRSFHVLSFPSWTSRLFPLVCSRTTWTFVYVVHCNLENHLGSLPPQRGTECTVVEKYE